MALFGKGGEVMNDEIDSAADNDSARTTSLLSAAANIAIPVAAWYAVNGNIGAGNVVKLLAAVTAILCPMVILAFIISPGNPVPKWREWMSHISDAATVSILAWHGWLWCALAFTIGWIVNVIMFGVKRNASIFKGRRHD